MDRSVPGPPRKSIAPPGYAGRAISSPTTARPFPRHLDAMRDATKVHGQNVAYGHGAVVPTQAFEAIMPPAPAVRAADAERAARAPAYGEQPTGRFRRQD